MSEAHRSDKRHDRRVKIDVQFGDNILSAYTRNISLGGVFVETEEVMPFGSRVSMQFSLPSAKEPIRVDGRIRWVETAVANTRGIGIRFEGLRAKDVWAITEYLEQLDEAAGSLGEALAEEASKQKK